MADSVTFLDNPVSIIDIRKDAQFYFADNGANKNDCEYFDNEGFAGLPDDSYSVADVRMNIQLGKKVGDPVTFAVDCIMEDGSYSSEIDPDKIKRQVEWDKFIKMNDPTYAKEIVQPLIKDLQDWANSEDTDAKDTCRNFLKSHELFKGQRPETIGNFIAKYIVRLLSPAKATDKELAINARTISNNLARAIEADSKPALDFFKACFMNVTEADLTKDFWKNVAELHAKYFPEITKAEVINKTAVDAKKKSTKLPKNVDTADELVDLIKSIDDNPSYEARFISRLQDLADSAERGSNEQKIAQFIAKILKAKQK